MAGEGAWFLPLLEALLFVIPLALSLAVQACAQALAAKALGDDTAQRAGRATLNPLVHIDPTGTVALPLLMALGQRHGAFVPLLGWAKPVPFDVARMRRNRSARACRALFATAAPAAALGLATLSAAALVVSAKYALVPAGAATDLARSLCGINVALALFQFVPLGHQCGFFWLVWLCPARLQSRIEGANERFGSFVLLAMVWLAPGLFGPPMRFVAGLLLRVVARVL